jgi:hypothetical protein
MHFDFRNNVVYNWMGNYGGYNDDGVGYVTRYNFIGNAFITGPNSTNNGKGFRESSKDAYGYFMDNSYNGVVPSDPWSIIVFNSSMMTADDITTYKARSYLVSMETVTTTSSAQAKIDVLASAGASLPNRDIIDTRIVTDVLNQTGHIINTTADQPEGAWPTLNLTTPPTDTDHDGMPDDWEIAQGLEPNNPADRNNVRPDGYTQLEAYLCSLTGEISTSVEEGSSQQPKQFVLHPNFPNPFNPSTQIQFSVPKDGHATLKVYNLVGQEVATLFDGTAKSGQFITKEFTGSRLSSGVYFARLQFNGSALVQRMLLLK